MLPWLMLHSLARGFTGIIRRLYNCLAGSRHGELFAPTLVPRRAASIGTNWMVEIDPAGRNSLRKRYD